MTSIQFKKIKTILCFLAALFILASCSTTKLDIDTVEFKAGACFGTCPVFDIKIANNRTALFNAIMFNKKQGKFKAVIERSKIDSLSMLLNKAGIFQLDDKYTTGMTDQPTYTLIVKLKSGQTKTIVDYGPNGPERLKDVYRLLFSLPSSQKWEQDASGK